MANFNPFRGYYPSPENAGNIAIDSYDNYSEQETKGILQNNPLSFINIIYKSKTTSIQDFYVQVRQRFNDFLKKKYLLQSSGVTYYIYKKTTGDHEYIGIIGLSDIKDLQSGLIKLHEQTLSKREYVLTQYLKEVKLNSEPIALVYEKKQKLSSFLQQYIQNTSSLLHFKDESTHTLWEVKNKTDIQFIQHEISTIDYLLVADGHHRIASSLRNFENNNDAPYFLSILFDHENVSIEPYSEGGKKYTFKEIKEITSQNKLLPPKSTWILPKLKTGLVIFDLQNWL